MLLKRMLIYPAVLLTAFGYANAQDGFLDTTPIPPQALAQKCENPEFGTYCYMHKFLHKHGVVQDLIKKSGKSCCDGGNGGECRVTRIRRDHNGWSFLHGKNWCNLQAEVRFDVTFPQAVQKEGVNAVVCASGYVVDGCPDGSYCAAIDFQPG